MRGKRAKAIKQAAMNNWLAVLIEQKDSGGAMPPMKALVHNPKDKRQAINHPESFRAVYRLMKQSWKRYASNNTRPFGAVGA